ncbi:MAG: aminopeptidase P family N-terminal domain-containing protein, partial [Desulfohalobiaceae bacterium]|nr:aminopeptidase P family N-terminal domain-containing protein [Desulfohalobiaceae bacterium]
MIHQYAARRDDLRQKIQELELDGYLVLHPANRFYLSGFELHDSQCNESAGCVLITAGGKDKLCTDPRYLDAARRVWPEEDIFVYKQDRLKMLLDFFKKSNMTRLGFESRSTSYETYKTLAEEIELEPFQGLTEELRKIKSQSEIDLLRDSCSLNHEVFSGIQGFVLSGVSESGLA